MSYIKENISRLKEDVSKICQKVGRNPLDITLVGVTKFAPVEAIQESLDSGLEHIAENKVQEGQKKYTDLRSPTGKLTRHCIGHLQTNKVKDALKVFEMIQSVDSFKLASEIEKQAQKLNRQVDVLVQVNTSGEEQKFGSNKNEALELLGQISELKNLHILGLMTIAPLTEDEKILRDCFRDLREIFEESGRSFKGSSHIQMKYLSMGMSGDYRIAIEEGSNMIRVGRAIYQQPVEASRV